MILFLIINEASASSSKREAPIYLEYVDDITKSLIKELEAEFEIHCEGSGGSMPYDVAEIDLSFVAYRKGTIKEARKIEVTATERLLKAINNHEGIRPYLREYPFRPERTLISINFRKSDNSTYTDGSIAFVFQAKNKIFYKADDPKTDLYYPVLVEPYEDALKIMNGIQKLK